MVPRCTIFFLNDKPILLDVKRKEDVVHLYVLMKNLSKILFLIDFLIKFISRYLWFWPLKHQIALRDPSYGVIRPIWLE